MYRVHHNHNHSPGALLSRCHWYWESNPHLVAISSSFAVLFLPSTRAGKLVRGRNRVWEYLTIYHGHEHKHSFRFWVYAVGFYALFGWFLGGVGWRLLGHAPDHHHHGAPGSPGLQQPAQLQVGGHPEAALQTWKCFINLFKSCLHRLLPSCK